jgi:hypothetical protein
MLVLFQSTHAVINAEKMCRQEGVQAKVIPVPRSLSSDCGMALDIATDQRERVAQLLENGRIDFQIHEQDEASSL